MLRSKSRTRCNREMNLYVYSMWVYRVETHARSLPGTCGPRAPRHIDIEFDESYKAHGTFVQRLSAEPRIPKPEGMQYVPETNAEVHYMLLGILLRPLRLPEADLSVTQPERMLQAYRQLCTAPEGEEPWPAVARRALARHGHLICKLLHLRCPAPALHLWCPARIVRTAGSGQLFCR